ncbi:MAG: hypothetical protein DMF62_17455 [Acidobacteria bacterium]|nr:MAG: hypothetical protein DMF62_17455 [Acidobacteriota bacterium]
MFCSKCGSPNADDTKFCRVCGADVSNMPAALARKRTGDLSLEEKQIDLYGSGMRGALIGLGFIISSGIAFAISMRVAVLALFFLAFASYFLGTGISRLLQSRALKRLIDRDKPELPPAAPGELPESFKPVRSIYETDDLAQLPASVTEHTTMHLDNRKSE